jgi:hypothetical protein
LLPAAVLAFIMAVMVFVPVAFDAIFMPVVILMLDDYSRVVPVVVHVHSVSVIVAAPGRAKEHCQSQRRNYHHRYLQMSHTKLHS